MPRRARAGKKSPEPRRRTACRVRGKRSNRDHVFDLGETILQGRWTAALQTQPAPVLRGEVLPERVPAIAAC